MLRLFRLPILPFLLFAGCAGLPSSRHDLGHAGFIAYWPQPDHHGLRLAIKDNIDMQGVVTTAGSAYLAAHAPPARKDAACLAGARRRHVEIIGKTDLPEFAVAPSGINEYFGTPHNPLCHFWKRVPGGSSSGSAVAVALGTADVAYGTDTAGSVRVPAACCGVVGLKTTRGLVPLDGVYPIAPVVLDTVGPMGKDIAHTVEGMDLLVPGAASRYAAARSAKPVGADIRVGRLHVKGTDAKIDQAVDRALALAGFHVMPLGEQFAKDWDQAKSDGDTIAAVGTWENYQKYGSNLGISGRTKSAILVGHLEYGSRYEEALARQHAWHEEMQRVLRRVDFIALPTLQTIPPLLLVNLRVGVMDARMLGLQNTVPVNCAGNPAISVPIPLASGGFPSTGLQLVGRERDEAGLLNAGRIVEAGLKK
jgi:Asp-tRNA(Asn)/Glu-tRNA(Gln) amidotransferase A subunit family amidase